VVAIELGTTTNHRFKSLEEWMRPGIQLAGIEFEAIRESGERPCGPSQFNSASTVAVQ